LLGAYVSDDPCKYQAYFTEEQARAFYGSDYEEYYEKVASAVSAVRSEIITYEGEPIAAAFHAVSSGKTESAENIWGFSAGYLVPVSSPWDETAEGFLSINTFTYDELYTRLASAGYAADENADKSELITDVTESGTVKKMQICGVTITGMELREILSLKSPVFEAEYDSTADSYIFTVKGSGHGVGMSQYGANSMAQDGYTYRDILEHYYTGVEVTEWAGMA
jgi:stage II sporulation protein D